MEKLSLVLCGAFLPKLGPASEHICFSGFTQRFAGNFTGYTIYDVYLFTDIYLFIVPVVTKMQEMPLKMFKI